MKWVLIIALYRGGVNHIEFNYYTDSARNRAACINAAQAFKQRTNGDWNGVVAVCVPKGVSE